MNDEQLERMLRVAFESDAARVPLVQPEWDGIVRLRQHRPGPPAHRVRALVAVAVFVVALAALGVAASRSGGDGPTAAPPPGPTSAAVSVPPSSAPSSPEATVTTAPRSTTTEPPTTTTTTQASTTVGPPVTLPGAGSPEVPATVPGPPDRYYRFAPDLDLAWVDPGTGTRLCWRTPVDEDCAPDPGPGGTLTVPSSAEHTVVLVFGPAVAVTVSFTDGGSTSIPVVRPDPRLDLGLARLTAPAGAVASVTPG